MHETTRANLRHSAQLIYALWRQQPRPELEPPYSTALALLDQLSTGPQTPEQLAAALSLHHNTVREYLSCLSAGGIAIAASSTRTRGQATGRPEALYSLQTRQNRP